MLRNTIIGEFIKIIKMCQVRRNWRKLHPCSETTPMNTFDFNHVEVGIGTYGELNIVDFGGDCKLHLGNYVSIAQRVSFLLNAEHYLNHISTYPFKVKLLKIQKEESFGKGDIIVGDDVWIGYGAIIMSGVHIGQGAVVAAGAVVTKDVAPYAIVGGNPAKLIRYRFDQEVRKVLETFDYSKLDENKVKRNIDDIYSASSDVIKIKNNLE